MVSKSIRMENWVEAYDGPVLLSDSFSNGGWGLEKGLSLAGLGKIVAVRLSCLDHVQIATLMSSGYS